MPRRRIAVIGDFHGYTKVEAFEQFLSEARPDAVLQVGDCQHYEDMPVPFWFIHGNHEDWTIIDALRKGSGYARKNLHYVRDAQPFDLFGLRVAGLGGVPRKDSTKDSPKFYDPTAYETLSQLSGLDIVLTHDTPLRFSNGRPELTCEEYRVLAEVIQPRFWFSGHHHHFDTEQLGDTTLVSLGKWPHQWVVIDLDEATGDLSWQRWRPLDARRYDAQLPRWEERERALKRQINATHTASEAKLRRTGQLR